MHKEEIRKRMEEYRKTHKEEIRKYKNILKEIEKLISKWCKKLYNRYWEYLIGGMIWLEEEELKSQ